MTKKQVVREERLSRKKMIGLRVQKQKHVVNAGRLGSRANVETKGRSDVQAGTRRRPLSSHIH